MRDEVADALAFEIGFAVVVERFFVLLSGHHGGRVSLKSVARPSLAQSSQLFKDAIFALEPYLMMPKLSHFPRGLLSLFQRQGRNKQIAAPKKRARHTIGLVVGLWRSTQFDS